MNVPTAYATLEEITDAIYWGRRDRFVTNWGILILTSTHESRNMASFQALWQNGVNEPLIKVSKEFPLTGQCHDPNDEMKEIRRSVLEATKEVWDWRAALYPV